MPMASHWPREFVASVFFILEQRAAIWNRIYFVIPAKAVMRTVFRSQLSALCSRPSHAVQSVPDLRRECPVGANV